MSKLSVPLITVRVSRGQHPSEGLRSSSEVLHSPFHGALVFLVFASAVHRVASLLRRVASYSVAAAPSLPRCLSGPSCFPAAPLVGENLVNHFLLRFHLCVKICD